MYFYVEKENSQVSEKHCMDFRKITMFTSCNRNIYKRILWFSFFPQTLEPYEIHLFNAKSEQNDVHCQESSRIVISKEKGTNIKIIHWKGARVQAGHNKYFINACF